MASPVAKRKRPAPANHAFFAPRAVPLMGARLEGVFGAARLLDDPMDDLSHDCVCTFGAYEE